MIVIMARVYELQSAQELYSMQIEATILNKLLCQEFISPI